jgi:hypothetical protein
VRGRSILQLQKCITFRSALATGLRDARSRLARTPNSVQTSTPDNLQSDTKNSLSFHFE